MAEERDFYHLRTLQIDSGPHQSFSPLGTRVLSLLGEADHSTPPGAKAKIALSCVFICDIP